MSLFLDIGQGAGIASATGVRPFLPPLLAGALAREDAGIDFTGTDWAFLEGTAFLAAVLALAVVSYALDRAGVGRRQAADPVPESAQARNPVDAGFGLVGLALGALLFAGSLADGDHPGWPGMIAGLLCAGLGYAAAASFFGRARRRLDSGAAGLLDVYADLIALALAGLSILAPPVGFLALAAFAYLLVRGRGQGDRKYEGLRILR